MFRLKFSIILAITFIGIAAVHYLTNESRFGDCFTYFKPEDKYYYNLCLEFYYIGLLRTFLLILLPTTIVVWLFPIKNKG